MGLLTKKLLSLIVFTSVFLLASCSKTITYNIIFDSVGGSNVSNQIVEDGSFILRPDDPVKKGFSFIEWQVDNAVFDFSTTITKELTLKAIYSIDEGTEIILVTLDYQNGAAKNIVEIGKSSKFLELAPPFKNGYKFVGWYINENVFDFSSILDENTTLIARWEVDSDASSKSNNVNDLDDSLMNSDSRSNDEPIVEDDFKKILEKYSGRWYLNNHKDVFIDVTDKVWPQSMEISATNFSLPDPYGNPIDVPPYAIYPGKLLSPELGGGWGGSFDILYNDWDNSLIKNKVILGDDCIYIDNNKFVKIKGYIDRYYGTPYKEVLGTWYLYNKPESSVTISKNFTGNLINSDEFIITTSNLFFVNNWHFLDNCYGDADRIEDWNNCGISSIENSVLNIVIKTEKLSFYRDKITVKTTGISLDETDVSLKIGEKKELNPTISPSDAYNKNITWSSSNPNVASVSSSGVITAKNEGSATISVLTDDGKHKATSNVEVVYIHVNDIQLNQKSLNLKLKEEFQLSATVLPNNAENKNITWTSSDSTIASVSATGIVSAISEGETTITAKSSDGGLTATSMVTVYFNHAEEISLNYTVLELFLRDTKQLIATVLPVNADDKSVTWSSSDGSIAEVSTSGLIIAKKKGSATITVKTIDGGYIAKTTVTVKEPLLTVISSTGIQTVITENGITKGVFVSVTANGGSGSYVNYSIKLYYNGAFVGEVLKNELFVTPIRNGEYTAEVYVKDSSGNEAYTSTTTTISIS